MVTPLHIMVVDQVQISRPMVPLVLMALVAVEVVEDILDMVVIQVVLALLLSGIKSHKPIYIVSQHP
tara:strand:- start:185 stop:385 length:201 start_codon:yes stop_codon:yes gene_type:complete